MHEDFPVLRDHLKRHMHTTVARALAEFATLAECVVVLSPPNVPRIIERRVAREVLKRDYPSFLFEVDLADVEDEDELALLWKDGELPRADTLSVGCGGKKPKPLAIPPFTPMRIDDAWIAGAADMILGLQQQVHDSIAEIGDDPSRVHDLLVALRRESDARRSKGSKGGARRSPEVETDPPARVHAMRRSPHPRRDEQRAYAVRAAEQGGVAHGVHAQSLP